ncbi:MAG: hypothetical protein GX102_03340 [Porphyromonadaceae bacterium]|nr:hypothetical protein [Porphyromonadaceae bacterium]
MNRFKYTATLVLITLIYMSFAACSKDLGGVKNDKDSGITMKVNGEFWGTTINTLFTEAHESSTLGEFYVVYVGGQRTDAEDSETDVSVFNMFISIPKSKFKNPKGAYSIMKEDEVMASQASANYAVSTGSNQTWYASYNPENSTQAVGTVEITSFEIGEQSVFGHSTSKEGYTKLSGTFRMDLYALQDSPGAPLKVTEGKFNLKAGIGFDF